MQLRTLCMHVDSCGTFKNWGGGLQSSNTDIYYSIYVGVLGIVMF
jgi:hypothetical protein